MTGSAGVMALVLAETVAGTAALLWCTPLWREVKRGYFTLTGVILTILAFAAWRAADAGAIVGRRRRARGAVRLALASFDRDGACGRRCSSLKQNTAARGVGFLSRAGLDRRAGRDVGDRAPAQALALFELLAGAAFLGSVLDGLLLGHWYLTDRGLTPHADRTGRRSSCSSRS